MNPSLFIPLALLASSHRSAQSDKPSEINQSVWVVAEDDYVINTSWITYLTIRPAFTGGFYIQAYISTGASCTLKSGFKTRDAAFEWLKGESSK